MGLKSYYETSRMEIDSELEKMLNVETFDSSFSSIKQDKLSKLVYTREQAERIILKKTDRKAFLTELKRSIKPQVIDNMAKRLDGKSREEIENERKEQIKKFAKDMEDPEEIEKRLLDEETNRDKKEDKEKKDSRILRSEIIKLIYEETLKEYYRIVSDLQVGYNGEISRASSINGTRMDNKLVMYQNYLRKLDMWYGSINNGAHIAYDEKISSFINNEENKKLNNDLIVNKKRNTKFEEIERLNNKLDEISKKMVDISNLEDNSRAGTSELKELSKEYAKTKYELANIKPSIGILYAEEREAEKNEDFRRRLGLLTYEKYTNRKILDGNNKVKTNRDMIEDKKFTNKVNDTVNTIMNDNLQRAEKALEEFDEAINEGRIEDALQSLKVANELCHTASDIVADIDETGEKIEEVKGKIAENNNQAKRKELNNKLGIGAVYTDDEILANDLKSIRDSIKNGIERNKSISQRSTDDLVR